MAKEPDNLALRLLREIRATQESHGEMLQSHGQMLQSHGETLKSHGEVLQSHGEMLQHLERRVEDIYQISTHTLGVAANAHVRFEGLTARVDELTARVERLESKTAG
jgi:polyhydroxyalkanoate synthesis regulator phasin